MKVERKGSLWRMAHSWWVVLLFSIYYSWVAFLYIGIVARRWQWIFWGIIYTPPVLVDFVLADFLKQQEDWQYGLSILTAAVLYISSIVHGLKVRQKFLLIMEARALGVSHDELKQLDMEKNASRTADANRGADRVPASNQRSRETAASPVPAPNRFLPPQPEPVRETKAIDLNTASESELADLPGVGVILAKKAIRHREANGGFRTADEFFETLRLPPHAVVRLRPLVTVSAVLQAVSPSPEPDSPASMSPEAPPAPPASPSRGRVVDY